VHNKKFSSNEIPKLAVERLAKVGFGDLGDPEQASVMLSYHQPNISATVALMPFG